MKIQVFFIRAADYQVRSLSNNRAYDQSMIFVLQYDEAKLYSSKSPMKTHHIVACSDEQSHLYFGPVTLNYMATAKLEKIKIFVLFDIETNERGEHLFFVLDHTLQLDQVERGNVRAEQYCMLNKKIKSYCK